jgi:hypothetical protein
MSTVTICHSQRELARRVGAGIEIALFWCPPDDSTSIEVWHPVSGERLAFLVPGECALDAFHHPFAYLRRASSAERSPALETGARS